jgi:hypothetical protein
MLTILLAEPVFESMTPLAEQETELALHSLEIVLDARSSARSLGSPDSRSVRSQANP